MINSNSKASPNPLNSMEESTPLTTANNWLAIAQQLEQKDEYQAAISLLHRVLEAVRALNDKTERASSLSVVANNASWMAESALEKGYLRSNEPQLLAILNAALMDLEALKGEFKGQRKFARDMVDCIADLAVFFINTNEYQQAIGVAERAFKVAEANEYMAGTTSYARCIHCKAYGQEQLGRKQQAKESYIRALRVFISTDEWNDKDKDCTVAALMQHVKDLECDDEAPPAKLKTSNSSQGKLLSQFRTKKK